MKPVISIPVFCEIIGMLVGKGEKGFPGFQEMFKNFFFLGSCQVSPKAGIDLDMEP